MAILVIVVGVVDQYSPLCGLILGIMLIQNHNLTTFRENFPTSVPDLCESSCTVIGIIIGWRNDINY